MAETVLIEIKGKDNASHVFSGVAGVLNGMASVALGILSARVFERIGEAILGTVKAAAEAYTWYDSIRFALTELAKADIAQQMTNEMGELTVSMAEVQRQAAATSAETLNWLKTLTLTSPYTMRQINEMYRLTRAYGFQEEEARRVAEALIDYSAATGFGADVLHRLGLALGQVRQRGRLAGEEIRQLINTGIPVREIMAKAFGVTTMEMEKMIRKGLVPGGQALEEILKWMERFDGAGKRAIQTWWGMLSNMKDVKDLNMIAFFEGLAKVVGPAMTEAFRFLSSNEFMSFMTRLGESVGEFMANIMPDLEAIANTFIIFFDALDKDPSIGLFNTIQAIKDLFGGDTTDIYETIAIVEDITTVFATAKIVMGNLGTVIGPSLDRFAVAWQGFRTSISAWKDTEWAPGMADFITDVGAIGALSLPYSIDQFTSSLFRLKTWFDAGGGASLSDTAFALGRFAVGYLSAGIAALAMSVGALTSALSGDWAGARDAIKEYWDVLNELYMGVNTGEFGPNAMTGQQGAPLVFQAPPEVDVSAIGEKIRTELSNELNSMNDVVNSQTFRPQGVAAGEGLMDGIISGVDKKKGALEKKIKEIEALIARLAKIQSPSKVYMALGSKMGEGLVLGIAQGMDLGTVAGASKQLQSAVASNVDNSRMIGSMNVNINDKYDHLAFEREMRRYWGAE